MPRFIDAATVALETRGAESHRVRDPESNKRLRGVIL
jgi:hypothetical protein